MYVSVYVCMLVCMYVRVYVCMYVSVYVYMYVCKNYEFVRIAATSMLDWIKSGEHGQVVEYIPINGKAIFTQSYDLAFR